MIQLLDNHFKSFDDLPIFNSQYDSAEDSLPVPIIERHEIIIDNMNSYQNGIDLLNDVNSELSDEFNLDLDWVIALI